MLKAREQAPFLVLDLPVHTALLPATSMLAVERLLLSGIDTAGDPTQQHQQFNLALQIVRKDQLVRRDGPQTVNERIISWYTEPRPQAEAG